MLYNAAFMFKTQNMQTKEHIIGESTCPSKFKVIDVSKPFTLPPSNIQYLLLESVTLETLSRQGAY